MARPNRSFFFSGLRCCLFAKEKDIDPRLNLAGYTVPYDLATPHGPNVARWLRRFAIFPAILVSIANAFAADRDARRLCNQGDANQRIVACTNLLDLERRDAKVRARAYFNRALAYRQNGELDRAIADFGEVIRLDPNANAYVFRGDAYRSEGEFDRAIAEFDQAIRLDAKNATAYNDRGLSYRQKGDYDRAIADYNTAIRLAPVAQSYNNRGRAYAERGDYDRAIHDLTQAIRLDPMLASAYTTRGTAYRNKKEYDRAISDETEVIQLEPNAQTYLDRAESYRGKRDYDQAIKDATEAIKLDPKFAIAREIRGILFRLKGDYARAVLDYDELIRHDPTPSVYSNRGLAYAGMGEFDRAIADYDTALRKNPKFAIAFQNRGAAYARKGDYDRAVADYSEAVKLNPRNSDFLIFRAEAEAAKGDLLPALADYEAALEISPESTKAVAGRDNVQSRLASVRSQAPGSTDTESGLARIVGEWNNNSTAENIVIRSTPLGYEAWVSHLGQASLSISSRKGGNLELSTRDLSCLYLVTFTAGEQMNWQLREGPSEKCLNGQFTKALAK